MTDQKKCPECDQNRDSGMNYCAYCGRDLRRPVVMNEFEEMCRAKWVQDRAEWKVGAGTDKGTIVGFPFSKKCNRKLIYIQDTENIFFKEELTYLPDIKTMLGWLPETRASEKFNGIFWFLKYYNYECKITDEEAVLAFVGHELGHEWTGEEWVK